jgi:hypothetical protein
LFDTQTVLWKYLRRKSFVEKLIRAELFETRRKHNDAFWLGFEHDNLIQVESAELELYFALLRHKIFIPKQQKSKGNKYLPLIYLF